MKKFESKFSPLVVVAMLALLVGCTESQPTTPPAKSPSAGESDDHGHAHGAGPHDGTVADWGGGKYHVEFTVDHDKQEATVYILGDDEKSPVPIKAESIELSIKDPMMQVTMKATPQEGEPEGSASRFVGNDKGLGVVQEYEGAISGVVDGTPYSGDFKEEPHGAHAH